MDVTLEEILRLAEDESAQYHHYYVGVEHLFIALTKLRNGLTSKVLEACNLEPRFVRYSVRQTAGINEDRRFWSGFPRTPRAQHILESVKDIDDSGERDVLLAILEEADNIPIRVLEEIGADISRLEETVRTWDGDVVAEPPPVPVDSTILADNPLSEDELAVLKRMFRTHERLVIEQELSGGYTGARLLLVQPYRARRAEARVVVKIDERESVLYEKRHYDSYVQYSLPPTTTRLLDTPALPPDCPLGGLKYTFVQPSGVTSALDLRDFASTARPEELSDMIKHGIYENYRETWWSQQQRYRFGVWREYEQTLPAAIAVEMVDPYSITQRPRTLRPLEPWSQSADIRPEEVVVLKDFTVQKISPEKGEIQLSADSGAEAVSRASKVIVTNVDKIKEFRRGMLVDMLYGRVTHNRSDILHEQIQWLEPDFDSVAPIIKTPEPLKPLPNPVYYVENFLSRQVSGNLSIIHGDLHLGNVIGRGNDAWLIDFGLAREGHTLYDWATLEISVLSSFVARFMPPGWDGVWGTIRLLDAINRGDLQSLPGEHPVVKSLIPIITIRQIVADNLAKSEHWQEYHIALMFLGLRGLSWRTTASIDVRRLLFLLAALSTSVVSDADSEIVTSTQATGFDLMVTDMFSDPEDNEGTAPYRSFSDDDEDIP